ncbi:DNA polymerase III subunit alpha [Verrucomicrobiota bacterium sgz303538]
MSDYVELHARSAFNFLRGASFPEQMAEVAAKLGLSALALHDRDGVYGAPRFYAEAREQGIRPIIGCELTMEDGLILPVLVQSRRGYQNLCRMLTRSRLRGTKTESAVLWSELEEFSEGLIALTDGGLREGMERFPLRCEMAQKRIEQLRQIFDGERLCVEIQRHCSRGESRINKAVRDLAQAYGLRLVATNGVAYATQAGREVLDVFTCIRNHTRLDLAGRLLERNAERYLKTHAQMDELFENLPEAIVNTRRIAEQLDFSLKDLGYEFPKYPTQDGESMERLLERVTWHGARERYGRKIPDNVQEQLRKELDLICRLRFAGYFLIVWDIVNYCRDQKIMVQGRGSAANSAVCYCLGITCFDPVKAQLLFERFLSEGRKSWPDIDLDLPSGELRERVIQEMYRRYGRHGAAMTGTVISYRGRSAARELGKVLALPNDVIDRFCHLFASGDFPHTLDLDKQQKLAGMAGGNPAAMKFAQLFPMLHGLPRHLGQHSGGMIICQGSLDCIVPLENASMPGRTVAQWDKDDCEDLGIIKVDLLGLGMMAVLQDCVELTKQRGRPVDLAHLPLEDAETYAMMQRADTIGVFQIESRAQMATLPRMQPKCFYDLVIEVAIIRPGPIQGHLMHPYLERRQGKAPPDCWDDRLKPILGRTLGVPLFQEQMLSIAMTMADFTGSEAEDLRRALSHHRSQERMNKVKEKLHAAMVRKEVKPDVIEQIVQAVSSFALYGFPESHAISFAHLAFASVYLKVHRTPEFFCAMLNNQPMGFYAPATLIKDAQRHGVKFRFVDVCVSDWFCSVNEDDSVQLGLCIVNGLDVRRADQLLAERQRAPWNSIDDFKRRTHLDKDQLRTLAEIGALNSFAPHRRAALWQVEQPVESDDLFAWAAGNSDAGKVAETAPLAPMTEAERMQTDYAGTNLTIARHTMSLLRPQLLDCWRAADLKRASDRERVRIAGNVICRQRPGTARGVVFISLEDETGIANAIVQPWLFERQRLLITQEAFLIIQGRVQHRDGTIHILAERIEPFRHQGLPGSGSHDFH